MNDDPFFADPAVHSGVVEEEDVPRERGTGRYLLPDPDTGEVQPHTRVTTLAGSLENGWMLNRWKIRQIIRGMGLRADLMARAGAAHPEDDGYNKLLDSIGDAAFEAAGGSWGSNLGTAQHSVFKKHFFHGVPIEQLPEYFQGDLRAVRAALDFHGIELLPEFVERTVRCSLYGRAGRIDAIGRLRDGSLVVVDLKTEKDPVQYPDGKTVQLAYYANSDLIMDYNTQQYVPMPSIHRDFALVIWCRPGSGKDWDGTDMATNPAKVLSVPIDIGWVGARIAEQNRAWRQQKLVIAPYMSDANWVPSDISAGAQPVATPNQQGYVVQQQQPAASREVLVPTIGPAGVCVTCQQILCPTCQECCSGQCPRTACRCVQIPGTGTWVPVEVAPAPPATPAMGQAPQQQPNGQGNYAQDAAQHRFPLAVGPQSYSAQVSEIVDQALASGQQLGPDQVAHLNQQAAAVVQGGPHPSTNGAAGLPAAPAEPPGQPVVGPGTNHPVTAGIHGSVPDDRPPTPKSKSGKMSPAELINDLLARPMEGIDTEAFWLEIKDELANLPKKELLQPVLRMLQPGIAEKELQRHRPPLAEMIIERVQQQREIRARQAGQQAQVPDQTPAQSAPMGQQPAAQPAQQPGWAQQPQGFGGPNGQVQADPPPFNGTANQPVDMTFGGVLAALASAPNEQTLITLYQQWIAVYGAQQWTQPLAEAYWTRHAMVTQQPTSVG